MIEEDNKLLKLDSYKTEILRKSIYSNDNIEKYSCCPHCGNKHFIKFGKYNSIQRYRCKKCNKTFSNTTNSLWKYIKKPPEKWFEFLELLGEKRTLEYCSKVLEISIVTAFNWRHKVLHGLENLYRPNELKDIIMMEVWYCRRNYKGSRNKYYEFKNEFHKRYNLAMGEVCTIISYDSKDSMIIDNIGIYDRYRINTYSEIQEKFVKNILTLCNEKSFIRLEPFGCDLIYKQVIKHNKRVPIKKRKMYNFNPKSTILMDNIKCNSKTSNIGVQFMEWLGDFRGVATKYLNHYCKLFSLFFVDRTFDYIKIFFDLLSSDCTYTSSTLMKKFHPENY